MESSKNERESPQGGSIHHRAEGAVGDGAQCSEGPKKQLKSLFDEVAPANKGQKGVAFEEGTEEPSVDVPTAEVLEVGEGDPATEEPPQDKGAATAAPVGTGGEDPAGLRVRLALSNTAWEQAQVALEAAKRALQESQERARGLEESHKALRSDLQRANSEKEAAEAAKTRAEKDSLLANGQVRNKEKSRQAAEAAKAKAEQERDALELRWREYREKRDEAVKEKEKVQGEAKAALEAAKESASNEVAKLKRKMALAKADREIAVAGLGEKADSALAEAMQLRESLRVAGEEIESPKSGRSLFVEVGARGKRKSGFDRPPTPVSEGGSRASPQEAGSAACANGAQG